MKLHIVATERAPVTLDVRDPKQGFASESEAFCNHRIAFGKILAGVSSRIGENLGQ